MRGRPPKVGHIRDTFLAASASAKELVEAVSTLASINPHVPGSRLHPEQARRVIELAFLGLMSAWEEFLEQSFVRYLAGAASCNGYTAPLRMGRAASISHAYQLISGDPDFDPTRNYSRFGEPRWVVATAKNYFDQGAPYATKLHPNLQVLQEAVRLRNRVAHTSAKCREDFKRSARVHLGLPEGAPLIQGYRVGDLLSSPATQLFSQKAKDKGWTYFQAYNGRLRLICKEICPES